MRAERYAVSLALINRRERAASAVYEIVAAVTIDRGRMADG